MRSALVALAVGCVAGLGGIVVAAATDERDLAFTLDVAPERPVAVIHRTQVACERGVATAAEFDRVQILLGTFGAPGPPLTVSVRDAATGRQIAAGTLPAGARDNQGATVAVAPRVPEGREVDVCVRNDGAQRVALYGGPPTDAPDASAWVGVHPIAADLRMSFDRGEPTSALALVPDILERATRFRPDAVGAWFFWVLLAGMALGVPILLAVAVRLAAREPAPMEPRQD